MVVVNDDGDQDQGWARIFISGKVRHFIFRSILQLGEHLPFLKGFDKNVSQPVQLYQKPDT